MVDRQMQFLDHIGLRLRDPDCNVRELRQLPNIHSRSTRAAVEYLVKRK